MIIDSHCFVGLKILKTKIKTLLRFNNQYLCLVIIYFSQGIWINFKKLVNYLGFLPLNLIKRAINFYFRFQGKRQYKGQNETYGPQIVHLIYNSNIYFFRDYWRFVRSMGHIPKNKLHGIVAR